MIALGSYREAVDDLVSDVGSVGLEVQRRRTTQLLDPSRLAAEITRALELTPGGASRAVASMSREISEYRPNARSAAADLPSLVRILMLAQIDAMWWGHVPAYRTTHTVDSTTELVDVRTARQGRSSVRCRVQPRDSRAPAGPGRRTSHRAGSHAAHRWGRQPADPAGGQHVARGDLR